MDVTVDEVDSTLEKRFMREVNTILDNVLAEVSSREDRAYQKTLSCGAFTELTELHTHKRVLRLTGFLRFARRSLSVSLTN